MAPAGERSWRAAFPKQKRQRGAQPTRTRRVEIPSITPSIAPARLLQAVRGLALLPAPAFPPHCQLHPVHTPTCSTDSPCRSGFVHRTLCGRLCSCLSPGSFPGFQKPEIFWMNSCSECPNLPRAASGEGGMGQIQPGGHSTKSRTEGIKTNLLCCEVCSPQEPFPS